MQRYLMPYAFEISLGKSSIYEEGYEQKSI